MKYAAELVKICDSEVTILHVLKLSITDHPIEIETDSWNATCARGEAIVRHALDADYQIIVVENPA